MAQWVTVAALLGGATPATAQSDASATRGTALDTVVAVQDFFFEGRPWATQVIVDSLGTTELTRGLQATIRPVLWRVNGRWETLVDQVSLQYAVTKGANWRIEAGRFPSPIGLGMTENRASTNPGVLWCHRPYYSPLPLMGPGPASQSLISAVYPLGVLASASAAHWDARVAVVDRAPVDTWKATTKRPARTNAIVGGGFSPRQGVRVGVATAWGEMLPSSAADAAGPGRYNMWNVEGEWAFGYTRVSGEWTQARFNTAIGERAATGLTLQVRQTISPRWFAHSRATAVTAPSAFGQGLEARQDFASVDSTLGYLVNPDVTLRIGHSAIRGWGSQDLDHQLGLSMAWSHRWW